MALWGDVDVKNGTGTVTTTTSSTTVNGAGTAFTTELAIGQYITITDDSTGTEHQIRSITSNTVLELFAKPTEAESGKAFQITTKPSYDNENVVGMTSAEAGTLGAGPGWVKVTEGTGGRAGRVQYETLVAFGDHTKPSEAGSNADDATFGVITLATIADVSAATGQAETIQVVATTTNNVVPSYQWQLRTTGSYANLANGGVYSDVTTDTLAISDNTGLNGNRYRCVVSGAGATTVNSNGAKLIET